MPPPSAHPPRHAAPIRRLHALTALAIAAALIAIWVREDLEGKFWRHWLLEAHRHLGLAVGLFLLIRLLMRLMLGTPPQGGALWMRHAASVTHAALYALMGALPALGWWLSSARGQAVQLFGRWPLPLLCEPDPDLAELLAERHEQAAWLLLALLGLHMAAALWHHFVLRDGLLHRMWGNTRPTSR